MVPDSSAVLGLPNELELPLNAGHRSMCRYESKEDQSYMLVEWAIKKLVTPGAVSSHRITSEFHTDEFTH